jgi:hypothetical protein
MTEEHKPLPVAGYTAQPDTKVALVNEFKADEERLLRKIDKMSSELIFTLGGNDMRMAPLIVNHEYDQTLLAEARKTLIIGFMLLNRAVFQPQRIKLPEDEK